MNGAPTDPNPKARASIYPVILEWFRGQPKGLVLDVPAGYGYLSLQLKEMGFEVTCGEIEPEIFSAPGLTCVYTDLNRQIGVADGTFEYVCCVDGLEHTTDPYRAVEEIGRVLKPGGYGVFSIPNYSNLEKRLKFLWHGYLTKPVVDNGEKGDGRDLANLHNTPLTITLLEFLFRRNGLEIVAFKKDRAKRKMMLALYPMYCAMKIVNCCTSPSKRARRRTDITLHPDVVLGGNTLIIITKKS